MIYPIKIYDKENKIVKEYDENEALQMFIGDTYNVSKYEKNNFWDRIWIEKTGTIKPETCGPIKYKKRKKDQIVKCKNCQTELVTASRRRKWCSMLCKSRYIKKQNSQEEHPNPINIKLPEDPMENSVLIKCKNCGKNVRSKSPTRKWCTESCRKKFKKLGFTSNEIEWELKRCDPYPFHVYLHYKPKNMTIMQVSEHSIYEAKHFCLRELKWRLKNWDEYQKSRVRDDD